MDAFFKKYTEQLTTKKLESELANDQFKTLEKTLALLLYTKSGSVPKDALLVAIATDIERQQLDETKYKKLIENPSTVAEDCGYLITLNETTGVFRFDHVSVHRYFRHDKSMKNTALVAQLCLAYICSSAFSDGPKNAEWFNYRALRPFMQAHPFLEFASLNWANTVREVFDVKKKDDLEPDLEPLLKELFKKG